MPGIACFRPALALPVLHQLVDYNESGTDCPVCVLLNLNFLDAAVGFILHLTHLVGAGVSYGLDLPTGAAIVCTFGAFLTLQVVVEGILRR